MQLYWDRLFPGASVSPSVKQESWTPNNFYGPTSFQASVPMAGAGQEWGPHFLVVSEASKVMPDEMSEPLLKNGVLGRREEWLAGSEEAWLMKFRKGWYRLHLNRNLSDSERSALEIPSIYSQDGPATLKWSSSRSLLDGVVATRRPEEWWLEVWGIWGGARGSHQEVRHRWAESRDLEYKNHLSISGIFCIFHVCPTGLGIPPTTTRLSTQVLSCPHNCPVKQE